MKPINISQFFSLVKTSDFPCQATRGFYLITPLSGKPQKEEDQTELRKAREG